MFCGPPKLRDLAPRSAGSTDGAWGAFGCLVVLAILSLPFACVVAFVMLAGGCSGEDACEPQRHLDTTGNVIDCACDCDDEHACPTIPGSERSRVPDCWEEGTSDG